MFSLQKKQTSQFLLFLNILHSLPHDGYRELLAAIDRILKQIYSEIARNGPTVLQDSLSSELHDKLQWLCQSFFNPKEATPSTFAFIQRYSNAFLQDFSTNIEADKYNQEFPPDLVTLYQRLLLWKQHLLGEIQQQPRNTLDWSNCHLIPNILEIPGQHMSLNSPVLHPSTIQFIRPHTPSLYREPHAWRFVDLYDEQGHVHRFYLEQMEVEKLILQERTAYLQIFINQILQECDMVQMRHIRTHLPVVVNIAPSLRMVRYDPQSHTLDGILRNELKESFDEKQFEFILRLNHVNLPNSSAPQRKVNDSEALLSSVVPADRFLRYMYLYEMRLIVVSPTL